MTILDKLNELKRLSDAATSGPRESISLPMSEMQIRFRVMFWDGKENKLAASFSTYSEAEDYCWHWVSGGEVEIKKVWILK